ncbi:MAG: 16S rRNA (cytosine(1402)-N(4))-methyltransferase RsmH [Clostridia bacterium]
MEYRHIPVLYRETLDALAIKKDGIYLDGTLGGAGHSEGILKRLETGRLIANDLDIRAIDNAKQMLDAYGDKVTYIQDDYKNILSHLDLLKISLLDGILLDLGVSSHQIDTPERGFAYSKDAPLDMRMDEQGVLSAYDVINNYSEKELVKIFFEYGEERYARRIAAAIVSTRRDRHISTTFELADLVKSNYPKSYQLGHPAKRVFQAVRIEVNGELDGLYQAVMSMARRLKAGGRMAVITFHSLEDRIIKNCFRELESDCLCDKAKHPICICGKQREVKILTKKPIIAGKEELEYNKRAESAKLRVIEKI